MQSNETSESRALADRIVNYSDALAAIVFLGASGLGIAVADPDTRASINLISFWMVGGNIMIGSLFSFFLVLLRRWELELRGEAPEGSSVRRYSHYFYVARHCIVWISVVQIVIIMLLSQLD
ncbi:MAG: hypothetical protein V7711_08625 [Pseudomonadales bacterium]